MNGINRIMQPCPVMSPYCKLKQFALILFSALFLTVNAHADLDVDWTQIQNPRIKEAVLDLHQGNYFIGINRLIALRSYADLGQEEELTELLLGTLYLSYGMPKEATEIYLDLLDKGTNTITQEQLWFHVANIQYQRADYKAAEKSLTHIKGNLENELGEQQLYLEALLLMRRNQYGPAVDALNKIRSNSELSLYALYNLAVSLAKIGKKEQSIATFDQISKISGTNDSELQALKDKASVALGYIYLNENAPNKAKFYMQQVQLKGPLSNKALLGLGWTYSALNEHKKSLVTWMELTRRAKTDPSVMEAFLTIPYAYSKLEAMGQSLAGYEIAITEYKNAETRLNKLIAAVRKGEIIKPILSQPRGQKIAPDDIILKLPDSTDRHYLMYVISSHEFQESYKSYMELKFLSKRLLEWETTIEKFHGISTTFREAYMDRILKQQAQTDKTLDELEDYMNGIAINSLELQKDKTVKLISKAKFSMARIFDRSNINAE